MKTIVVNKRKKISFKSRISSFFALFGPSPGLINAEKKHDEVDDKTQSEYRRIMT